MFFFSFDFCISFFIVCSCLFSPYWFTFISEMDLMRKLIEIHEKFSTYVCFMRNNRKILLLLILRHFYKGEQLT